MLRCAFFTSKLTACCAGAVCVPGGVRAQAAAASQCVACDVVFTVLEVRMSPTPKAHFGHPTFPHLMAHVDGGCMTLQRRALTWCRWKGAQEGQEAHEH